MAVSLLFDGQISNSANLNALVFDESFEADIETQMWGTELNLFRDYAAAHTGLSWEPLAGIRLVNIQEEFHAVGVSNNGRQDPTDRITRFSARSTNNLWGPQVGTRITLSHPRFSLSATPRIAFALNNYSSRVNAGPYFDPVDPALVDPDDNRFVVPRTIEDDTEVDFSPVVQVSFKAHVHVNECFSLFAGYDFLWMHRLTRPFNDINYNSTRDDDQNIIPQLTRQNGWDSFWSNGFSAGGEIRFPR